MIESSSFSKKVAYYYEQAVKQLEESEEAHEITGFYKVKLSQSARESYGTELNVKKFPVIMVTSG